MATVAESAEVVRRRVRELVEEAARRLDVQILAFEEPKWSDPSLPAALDEFLMLIGSTSSDLGRTWFPGEFVGREVLSEGKERSQVTLATAGLPDELLGGFFWIQPQRTCDVLRTVLAVRLTEGVHGTSGGTTAHDFPTFDDVWEIESRQGERLEV